MIRTTATANTTQIWRQAAQYTQIDNVFTSMEVKLFTEQYGAQPGVG